MNFEDFEARLDEIDDWAKTQKAKIEHHQERERPLPEKLYHVTTKARLGSILREGIITPQSYILVIIML